MKFTDSLAVVTDDEGCDAIRDGDKSMRAGERIDLKLLFKLSLLLRLLLEAPRCGLCRHGCDTHVLRWRGLLLLRLLQGLLLGLIEVRKHHHLLLLLNRSWANLQLSRIGRRCNSYR